MQEERNQILAMLESGKLTPEQADELLETLTEPEEPTEIELPSAQVEPVSSRKIKKKSKKGPKRKFGSKAGFTAQEMIEMGIHGIDPTFVREMRELFADLKFEHIMEFGIHGIKPEFVKEVRGLELGELHAEDIIEMGIHGVDTEFVQELRAQNIPNLGLEEIIEFAIHGIDIEFIEKIRTLEEDVESEEDVSEEIEGESLG